MPRRTPAPRTRSRGRPPANAPVLDLPRLLAAADAQLARDGWTAFSMRRLAQTLAVDPMTLYRHVPSKETLGAMVIARRLEHLDPVATHRGRRSNSPAVRLHVLARAYLDIVADAPALVASLIADSGAASPAASRWLDLVAGALGEPGRASARTRTLAHTLADFVHGFALAPPPSNRAAFARSIALIAAGAARARRVCGARGDRQAIRSP